MPEVLLRHTHDGWSGAGPPARAAFLEAYAEAHRLALEATVAAHQRTLGRAMERERQRLERDERDKLEGMLGALGRHVASVVSDVGLVPEVALEVGGRRLLDKDAYEITAEQLVSEAGPVTRGERNQIDRIIQQAGISGWAEDKIKPWLERVWERGWYGADKVGAPGLTSSERDVQVRRIIREGGTRLGLIDIAEDTRLALFRVLELSREKGLGQASPRQVAQWIQDEVPAGRFVHAGPRYRAQLIARTEIMTSTRSAQLMQYEADRSVGKLMALDGDHDDVCAARNGSVFTFAQASSQNGSTHPNCTLSWVPAN